MSADEKPLGLVWRWFAGFSDSHPLAFGKQEVSEVMATIAVFFR
jgi:hypothetical protein